MKKTRKDRTEWLSYVLLFIIFDKVQKNDPFRSEGQET